MKLRCYVFGAVFTMLGLLVGCSPTRHLTGNERLLWKINLEGAQQNKKSALSPLYQQKPNRRVLGTPLYLNLYYLGKQFYNPEKIQAQKDQKTEEFNQDIARAGSDSIKVDKLIEKKEKKLGKLQNKLENGNWLMRTVGESPAIFDSTKLVSTEEQVKLYLNSKGFFRSTVSSSTATQDKKVTATIHITEDKPYVVTHHLYEVPDTALLGLMQRNQAASLVKLNQNFEEATLAQERVRLEQLFKNNGYFDFKQQFVTFNADTSYVDYTVRLKTQIANPTDSSFHKVYTIQNTYVTTDAGNNRFGVNRDTLLLNDIYFMAYEQRFKPKVMIRKVILRPGQTFSAARTQTNQRILSSMDVFKFATVTYTKKADSLSSTSRTGLLDANINMAPLPRYQETAEVGGTFTEQVPGPYSSLRLRIRNIFGGAEIFDIGVRAGIEGQLQVNEAVTGRRTEIGADFGVTFPQILVPFRTNDLLVRFNPRTRFSTGYTYVNRNEYTRTNLDFSFDYIWQRQNIHQFSFSPIDINIISTPKISDDFLKTLDEFEAQGSPLRQSFLNTFVSSMNFTSLYNTANYNQSNDAKLVRLFAETGGIIGRFLAKPFNDLTNYQFVKASVDYRRYHPLPNNFMFVYRVNGGVAKPFGRTQVLPYDKHFFAGGSSSVRAWLPRRLGPGSSRVIGLNEETGKYEIIYKFEQPGEILLEFNSEMRFRMFRFGTTNVNGAVFLDAGNIWLFNERSNVAPSGNFRYEGQGTFAFDRFYKEMAVGTGFGVRFDFTFAILRLDIATRMFDPAQPEGSRFVLNRFQPGNILSENTQTTFNLGIGYPF
ncbi:BamA/TamA family outer membrane protein [Rufibacter sp. LB8]|uniref:translocation and assembly module lipoprotein TamL n=2 Tax=Rufibacter sp. LB8 TaxID=2777781 RepID=UPI001CEF72D9|nr:BamA/TamA family outer membrane protein [Rufibacter sp. LB8]